MILTLVIAAISVAILGLFYFIGSATAKAAVKAELTKIEAEGEASVKTVSADAKAVIARIKTIL